MIYRILCRAARPADGAAWTVSNSQYQTQDVRFMSMQIVWASAPRALWALKDDFISAAALKPASSAGCCRSLNLILFKMVSPDVKQLVPTFYESKRFYWCLTNEEALLHLMRMSLQWEQMEFSHTDALFLVLEKCSLEAQTETFCSEHCAGQCRAATFNWLVGNYYINWRLF